jgi:hypothetical protein
MPIFEALAIAAPVAALLGFVVWVTSQALDGVRDCNESIPGQRVLFPKKDSDD